MTTASATAARRLTYQLEALWDFDYEPTHDELDALYETAKKNQWNASTAIDWTRPIGKDGPVLNVQVAFAGSNFFTRLTAEEQKEVEVRVSAWRLSQFLHGEQGALLVCGQLVNSVPELDAKLYASTQVVDEGRHVEVYERYVKKLLKIYPVDPLLKTLIDEILATPFWELKLLGMQMIIEGLAIAAFNVMRKQTGDPTLAQVLDYVLQDEGRHVNFGYFALRRSIPTMPPAWRIASSCLSSRFRGWSRMERAFACDAMKGARASSTTSQKVSGAACETSTITPNRFTAWPYITPPADGPTLPLPSAAASSTVCVPTGNQALPAPSGTPRLRIESVTAPARSCARTS